MQDDPYDTALRIVNRELRDRSTLCGHRLTVLFEKTRRLPFGWLFFYNTQKFAETGDPLDGVAGNGPILVDQERGEVVTLGTHAPVEQLLEEYLQTRDDA